MISQAAVVGLIENDAPGVLDRLGFSAETLQQAGIAAGLVVPAHALLEAPHLLAIGYWRQTERRYVSSHLGPKPPFAIAGRAPPLNSPAPTLGEQNTAVLTRIMKMHRTEIGELERDEIIGTKAI